MNTATYPAYPTEQSFFSEQHQFNIGLEPVVRSREAISNMIASSLSLKDGFSRVKQYRRCIVELCKLVQHLSDPTRLLDLELYNYWLNAAQEQMCSGKGHDRHGDENGQHAYTVMDYLEYHWRGFPLGQAVKKVLESGRLKPHHAIHELLGAINYLVLAAVREGANGAAA